MNPRSTPPHPRPRQRRQEILEQATQLFAERGYEGLSMADLAERVGLRKASLFHHFASKEVIYVEVLGRILEAVKEAIVRSAALPGSFQERQEALADAMVIVLGEHPYAARLLVREVMDWGPVLRDNLAEKVMFLLDAGEKFVRAGQADGAFVEMDPKQLILTFTGIYFMPFVLGEIVNRFAGVEPSSPTFVEARREAVRIHAGRLLFTGGVPAARRRQPPQP
jgi:AcrR family transcriptional regulator